MSDNHNWLERRVPLTIITGFLGAGKTTLLNRIVNAEHQQKIAVLVNDFGAINIDSQLVVGVEEDTINLSNGCICCTIRDDLRQAVLQLIQRDDPPDTLIVETSGVSDPLEVALTFKYTPQVSIDSILTVIDAEQILEVPREHAVLAMNQIGMADIILLNKVDLVDAAQLEAARRYVRQIMPSSRLYETTHAEIPLAFVLNSGGFDPERLASRPAADVHTHDSAAAIQPHHDHSDHSLVFETWSWHSEEPVSYRALKRLVDRLPTSIYRAKGLFHFAEDPERRGLLHVVGKRAELSSGEAWGEVTPYSQFVAIASQGGLDADELSARFEAVLAKNAPKNELERLANLALSWLRGGRA